MAGMNGSGRRRREFSRPTGGVSSSAPLAPGTPAEAGFLDRQLVSTPQTLETSPWGPTLQVNDNSPSGISSGLATRALALPARNHLVSSCMKFIEDLTFWVDGSVVPDARNDYTKHPEFHAFDDMLVPWLQRSLERMFDDDLYPRYNKFGDCLRDVFTSARRYGYVPAEKSWTFRDSRHVIRGLYPKAPWNFGPVPDLYGNLVAVFDYVLAREYMLTDDAIMLAIWPRANVENYFGESVIDPLLQHINDLEDFYRFRKENARVAAVQPLVVDMGVAGIGKDQVSRTRDAILQDIRSNGIIFLEQGWDAAKGIIKRIEIAPIGIRSEFTVFTDIDDMIKNIMSTIREGLGIPDDLLSTPVSVGSRAMLQTKFEAFLARIDAGRQWVSGLVDRQIIGSMIRWNFANLPPDYYWPTYTYPELKESVTLQEIQAFGQGLQMNAISMADPRDRNLVRDRLGFPPDLDSRHDAGSTATAAGGDEGPAAGGESPVSTEPAPVG